MYASAVNRFITINGYRIGTLSRAELEHLWLAVDQFGIARIRFTPGSQIAVSGLAEERLTEFIDRLRPLLTPLPTNGITAVYNCNEAGECTNGCLATGDIAEKLGALQLPVPMPARIKAAVAGCKRCCTMPLLRDIGLIPASARNRTYHVYFGGHGGRAPRIADRIGEHLSLDESFELIRRALIVYQNEAEPKMRTSAYMRTTNLESFLKKVDKNRIP